MNLANARETIAFAIEDLQKDLPPYKRIMGLKIFKESLPATRLGKLRRPLVKDLYLQGGERAEKAVPATQDKDVLTSDTGRKVLACITPFSAKKNIVPDDNLELDLGLDSLTRVELVVSLEKSFGLKLPESFGAEVFTVREVVAKVGDLLASGGAAAEGAPARLSWADILRQEPTEEIKKSLRLEPALLCIPARFLMVSFLKLFPRFYGGMRVRGLENLPPKGPYIITPNHLSNADAPLLLGALPFTVSRQTFFLGITNFFGGPVKSRIAKNIQVIPVDMDTKLFSALQLSSYILRNGKILCVFPEGGRSRDGNIKEFKKGVGILAKELNLPMVPVAINGTYEMMPAGRYFPKPSNVTISFGKPVHPGGKEYEAIVKKLYEEVVKLLDEDRKT
jgi:long-chain acyl-CoA synthetase